jgi:uncharacterized damage-inducible protein DinB
MMDPNKLVQLYKRTGWVIARQTEGLTHADSLLQLPFRGNCLNWVLGHIAVSRDHAIELLRGTPVLREDEAKLYQRESEPLTDPDKAVQLSQLLDALTRQEERILATLQAAEADALQAYVDDERKRTLGDRLEFLHWHETYHVGQLEILRQLAGTDDAII